MHSAQEAKLLSQIYANLPDSGDFLAKAVESPQSVAKENMKIGPATNVIT